jgi:hypothetical protein
LEALPSRYDELVSTVAEVMAAVSKYHTNPSSAGQVVLRPRFNNNEIGRSVLHTPPANVWIIEILGRFAMTHRDRVMTTRVVGYRDSDLIQLFGTFAP